MLISKQVAGLAGADYFGAAPYANLINVKTHGERGATAKCVARGMLRPFYISRSFLFALKPLEDNYEG